MTKREIWQNPEQCVTSHIISQAGKNNSLQSIHTLQLSVAFPLLTRPAFSVCPQKQLYVSCSSWRTNCLQQAGRNVLNQNSCRQAVSQSRIQCELIHLIKVEAYLLCDKTVPMWIGHGLPRSSWPALPPPFNACWRWDSCPCTDSCSDDFHLSCARAGMLPADWLE